MSSVRRTAALASLLTASLLVATVASAGPPRLEQKRFRSADMTLAAQIALRGSDLPRGWVRRGPTAFPERLPNCPGVDLDFSAFTITGRAQSKFTRGAAAIESLVEVFATRTQAVGDFRKGSAPALVACIGRELRRQGVNVVSAKITGRPTVGERALAFRVVMAAAGTIVYMDVLGFQRGRSIVGVYFTATRPIAGRVAVARSVAGRMR